MVNGVRHILYEMMYNVADNAIKYNHEGGYVKVKVKKNQNQVKISIEDNGIGIKKEEQERIFERFFTVDKSHSGKNGGFGLGLAVVKKICRKAGWTLHVQSVLGEGTTFTVDFNCKD